MSDTNRTPDFSIITITRNNRAGLARTVESVDAQLHGSWEHLVIDGASTDGSVEWLAELPQRPERTWTSESDKGIYDAMNKGLRRAAGSIVIMMNSGDTFSGPDSLAVIAASHAEHRWQWAYGAVRFTDAAGNVEGAYCFDPFKRHLFTLGLNWIPHATVAMTRQLCTELGPYRADLGTAADQEYLMRAAGRAEPHVISWFIADYESGGVSYQMSGRERELAWHRMRDATNQLWRNSRVGDRAVSEVLALRHVLRAGLKRVHGSIGP